MKKTSNDDEAYIKAEHLARYDRMVEGHARRAVAALVADALLDPGLYPPAAIARADRARRLRRT